MTTLTFSSAKDAYYHNIPFTMTVTTDPHWYIVVKQGEGTIYISNETSLGYHRRKVNIRYVRYEGMMMPRKYFEQCVYKTIDAHEKFMVMLMLVGWRPDMRDMWRELRNYLT